MPNPTAVTPDYSVEDMTVQIMSFYYSWGRDKHVNLGIHGQVQRPGILCKFELETGTKKQSKLKFKEATIFDGSDPKTIALGVKNCIRDFVQTNSDVPERFRPWLMDAVLKHPQVGSYAK